MRGPHLYRVPGVETPLAAATSILVPTIGTPTRFIFPRELLVEGIFLMPLSADPVAAAGLGLLIEDEYGITLGTDGRFSEFVPSLAMQGQNWRWFPLCRPVRAMKYWIFTMQNTSTVSEVTPRVFLHIGDL